MTMRKKMLNVTSHEPGHHSSEGRNIIDADGNTEGHDIFFAAVQMSRMPMVLSDPHQPDNPIIFCNQAFEQLVGYPQEEIIGRNCRFLQGENTDRDTIADIRKALANGEDVHEEVLNYRKDGSAFWNALFISPVNDTNGNLVYHFASQLNVTRRREAEAVLQQSQRMETLGAMASSVAHEFNNLMTVVLASLERLRVVKDEMQRDKHLDRAFWGASRAGKLTDQMLSFARRQYHQNQRLDVNAMLSNFDTILRHVAGNTVQLQVELSGEKLITMVDPGQLELALLNLMRNAIDAMVDGGTVRIETRARNCDSFFEQDAVEISLSDTGPGMSPEVLQRATEPFFTTKDKGKGTGLGLSMVSGFAEQSDGKLEIESVIGQGTTMRLVFPMVN